MPAILQGYAASATLAAKPIKQRPQAQPKSQLPDSAAGLVNAMSAHFEPIVPLNKNEDEQS
jgi:hypothetical protein